jgi:hypothetical protein
MISRPRALALASVIVGSSIAVLPGRASAQGAAPSRPEPGAEADRTPLVVLLFDPDRPDSNRLISAIESHLAGLPVQVALEPLPRSDILTWLGSGHIRARARQALGLLAIDTSRGDVWRLFFLDVDGAPTLIRRLPSSSKHEPLDEAGIAVRLLVEALLDSKQIPAADTMSGGRAPPKAAVPAARTPTKPGGAATATGSKSPAQQSRPLVVPKTEDTQAADANRRPQPLSVFLGPVGATWLARQAWQFGATAGAELELARAWSLAVAYALYPALTYHLTDTDLTLSRHPVTSFLAYTPRLGLSPRFWLGLGVNAVHRETIGTGAAYRSTDAETTWSWGPIGGVGVITPAVSAFSARFDLGVQVPVRRIHYVTQPDSRLVATTRPAIPFVSICLSLRL